jgi:hypothetical protein
LIETLARTVHTIHQQQIIHRDLKPANLLFTADGLPKIADFGLARRLDAEKQTQTGAIMGTPSYMSPEQARGDATQIGPAADIYALGALLYACLTGRAPFCAASPLDTLLQVLEKNPPGPRCLNSSVNEDLDTICLKCLEKKPQERYLTADELAEDLRRVQKAEPIKARPLGPWMRVSRRIRQHWREAALVVSGMAVTVTLGGLYLTLDLPGPLFLGFYCVALSMSAVIALALRWLLRVPSDQPPAMALEIDPRVTTYLSGHTEGSVPPDVAEQLRDLRLVLDEEQAWIARLVPAFVVMSVAVFGAIKVAVGLARGRPVGFLILLCLAIVGVAFLFYAVRPYRSRRGDRLLRQLKVRAKLRAE